MDGADLNVTVMPLEVVCGQYAVVVEVLEKMGESRTQAGVLDSQLGIVEVWTAKEGESWSIIVAVPSGTTCVLATGQAWQKAPGNPPRQTL